MVAARGGGGEEGGQRSISRCYAEGYFAWRGRAISCVREMWQEFESAPPSPPPLNFLQRDRSTRVIRPAGRCCIRAAETRNDSTPREIVSTPRHRSRANRFLFTVSRKEQRLLRSCLSLSLFLSRYSRVGTNVSRDSVLRMRKRTLYISALIYKD